MQNPEFDGVFRFTNASAEDFTALWNNREYIFPAMSTCPMIMPEETMESIQEIRKRFAKRFAEREYFKTQSYSAIKNGDGKSVLSMFNDKELQPWVDQCLEPLPVATAEVKKVPKKEGSFRASKAVGTKDNLNVIFKDEEIPEVGEVSD